MSRSPGNAAETASRRAGVKSAAASRGGSSCERGCQFSEMNSRNAADWGRWERLEPRSDRGWSDPLASVIPAIVSRAKGRHRAGEADYPKRRGDRSTYPFIGVRWHGHPPGTDVEC